MSLDIDDLKQRFLKVDFDEQTFSVTAAQLVDYAKTCGELAPRYTDPTHPDFQALPTFPSSFNAGRRLPDGFPNLPGMGMDAGKAVSPKQPIRPDTPLTGRSHIHDIYAKSGRSGRMVFIVLRMELYDAANTHLASADTSMVIRERPERMTIKTVADVEFGAQLPVFAPDTGLDNVRRFARAAGWYRPRFIDHDAARAEGLPGALVPGIMSQGFLVAMIHRWAPDAQILNVDTVFRAPVVVDEAYRISGVVTDIDEDAGTVVIDLTVSNAANETRVFGTASVKLPA